MAAPSELFSIPKRVRIYVGGREFTARTEVLNSEEGKHVAQKLKNDGLVMTGPYGEFYVAFDPDILQAILIYLDANVLECADRFLRDVQRAANDFNLSDLATMCENRLDQGPVPRDDGSREESADRGDGSTSGNAPKTETVVEDPVQADVTVGFNWNPRVRPYYPREHPRHPSNVLRHAVQQAVDETWSHANAGKQKHNAPRRHDSAAAENINDCVTESLAPLNSMSTM